MTAPHFPGLCVVVLPTYNRAHTLARALDSLLAQTDQEWACLVVDDGSTDGTADLLREKYVGHDPRIYHAQLATNQGGVKANEIGMELAVRNGTWWTRLGSDDVFLSHKLELDRIALAEHGACFGPYRHRTVFRGPWRDGVEWTEELNVPQDARATLLAGSFAASWANIAMRTDVLRQVHDAFGSFVDQRLRNMEDYLFNVRAARFTDFAWRARSEDYHHVIVGATAPAQVPFPYLPDALYTVSTEGASYAASMRDWLIQDGEMTSRCRGEDHARGIQPLVLPPMRTEIYAL